MECNYTKTLLVTANVGSIFEDPDRMLHMWLSEFLATVRRLDPDFLAVHCQEVGGKNYEESMQHVNKFIKTLLARQEMQQFDKARVFLDEDFTAVDKFTALGCLYFIHQSVKNVQIYDFERLTFVPVVGREVLSGNIENVPIKEKSKFPQEFFPDFKWSRKGFIRTRWNVHNCVLDLINIHLFHDASNIVAMESTPSVYSDNRERTLQHTLQRLENDQHAKVPYFLFGDFNFRLDSRSLIKKLTNNTAAHHTKGKKNDISRIVFSEQTNGKPVLVVEKKAFEHHQHSDVFSNNNGKWLSEYDIEPVGFKSKLFEYEVTFPPSYPFIEDVKDGLSYMKTRCPSWCDRIMFSPDAKHIIIQDGPANTPEYNIIGYNTCMGDHKPIYLNLKLLHGAGNNESIPSADDESATAKPLLRKVISINGEEVEISSVSDINIHDFATFELEEHIADNFMNSIKRKSIDSTEGSPDKDKLKRPSFKQIARDVCRAENVLLALKHYSHRSDSEPETEEECVESDVEPQTNSKSDLTLAEPENNNVTFTCKNTNQEEDGVTDVATPQTQKHNTDNPTSPMTPETESVSSSPQHPASPTDVTFSVEQDSPSTSSPDNSEAQLLSRPPKRHHIRSNPPARRVSQMRSSNKESSMCTCCVLL